MSVYGKNNYLPSFGTRYETSAGSASCRDLKRVMNRLEKGVSYDEQRAFGVRRARSTASTRKTEQG